MFRKHALFLMVLVLCLVLMPGVATMQEQAPLSPPLPPEAGSSEGGAILIAWVVVAFCLAGIITYAIRKYGKARNLFSMLMVLCLVLMPGAAAAQENTPDGEPQIVVQQVEPEQGLTTQDAIWIAWAVVGLCIAGAIVYAAGQFSKGAQLNVGRATELYKQWDGDPRVLAFGNTAAGHSVYAGFEALIEKVDDPDDPLVQMVTKTMLKTQIADILMQRYPDLTRDKVQQAVSDLAEQALRLGRDLFDGKRSELYITLPDEESRQRFTADLVDRVKKAGIQP